MPCQIPLKGSSTERQSRTEFRKGPERSLRPAAVRRAGTRTCAQQVLQGIRVLQQAAGVQPGLQAVAVAIVAFRVVVKLLQTAVATELHRQGLPVPCGAVHIVDSRLGKVLETSQPTGSSGDPAEHHPCGRSAETGERYPDACVPGVQKGARETLETHVQGRHEAQG